MSIYAYFYPLCLFVVRYTSPFYTFTIYTYISINYISHDASGADSFRLPGPDERRIQVKYKWVIPEEQSATFQSQGTNNNKGNTSMDY